MRITKNIIFLKFIYNRLYIRNLKPNSVKNGDYMLLAVDIGNTNIVWGVFKEQTLVRSWRFDSQSQKTQDEWYALLHILFAGAGLSLKELTGIAISSVVPAVTNTISSFSRNAFSIEPFLITSDLDLGITVLYDDPTAVGADRLCNAVAALALYQAPLIIIDFGTATTYDVISEKGEYLGGIIAPGLETAARILHQRAAKLPSVELQFPDTVIGTNTERSIQSGILYGAVASLEGIIELINTELGYETTVIATGGLAQLISEKTTAIDYFVPDLTLMGIEKIYRKIHSY